MVRPVSPDHILDEARLTLDYDVDFELFRIVFEALEADGHVAGLSDVTQFLRAHPELMQINAGLDESYWQRTRDKAQLSFRDDDGNTRDIAV